LQVLAWNATFDRVQCTVPRGAGIDMQFTLTVCAPGLFGGSRRCGNSRLDLCGVLLSTGCYAVVDTGNNKLSYALPDISPGSLCYSATPLITSFDIGAFNSLATLVSFAATNLYNDTGLLQV
jgi:hypothetical protein